MYIYIYKSRTTYIYINTYIYMGRTSKSPTTSGAPLRNTCDPLSCSLRTTTDMRW